ncbi:energy-coupling factor transporter transmembrane component T family protein [Paenibacillus cremeus]|uniref:energy-coupling factor transporter transmembrane component T family protein n=1 Tax=Paenibacillus cremeus TaxID=2163881 RepID=UPI001C93EB8C|nr:energy-coupling factor transporter transmembrane component T [Paenibacillus cremeus]
MTITYPPLRIVAALLMIVIGVSVHHTETLLLLLAVGQGWIGVYRVPLSQFWRRLRLAVPFILFSFVFFSFYEHGAMISIAPFLQISVDGLGKAFVYSARLVFTLQVLTLLFNGMPLPVFFQSLVQLKLPGIFVELMLFTLRFMEVIRDEALRMLQALRSRGMQRKTFFSLSAYLILSRLLGSLLLRSFQRSERIYMGMMSRGYRGIPPAQDLEPYQSTDIARLLLWVLPVLGLWLLDLIYM